jgi:hypothetical protein
VEPAGWAEVEAVAAWAAEAEEEAVAEAEVSAAEAEEEAAAAAEAVVAEAEEEAAAEAEAVVAEAEEVGAGVAAAAAGTTGSRRGRKHRRALRGGARPLPATSRSAAAFRHLNGCPPFVDTA